MTRIGKQQHRRMKCPRKRQHLLTTKTGPKKDALEKGYKEHENGLKDFSNHLHAFIPKVK